MMVADNGVPRAAPQAACDTPLSTEQLVLWAQLISPDTTSASALTPAAQEEATRELQALLLEAQAGNRAAAAATAAAVQAAAAASQAQDRASAFARAIAAANGFKSSDPPGAAASTPPPRAPLLSFVSLDSATATSNEGCLTSNSSLGALGADWRSLALFPGSSSDASGPGLFGTINAEPVNPTWLSYSGPTVSPLVSTGADLAAMASARADFDARYGVGSLMMDP